MNSRALRRALTRAAGALAVLALSTGGLLISGTTAQAADASGTLTLTSDPGDIIGDGLSYSFDSSAADRFSAISYPGHDGASVSVTGADGDDWVLDLAAAHGKALTTGTYSDAGSTNDPQRTGPGLSVRHFGTDCYSATGSFTITTITFGPYGYLSELDASFEQHCEGAAAAIRGEVHVTNPAPTPALEIGVAVSADGQADTLNGKALVQGTVTCNEPVTVGLTGSVTEVAHRVLINGDFTASADCVPGTPATWTASATPKATTPFQKGDVEVDAQASAPDPSYFDQYAYASRTAKVHLVKYQP